MTDLDKRLVPRVQKILDKYGKTVTVTVKGIANYNVGDGTVDEAGETTYTTKITPPEPWTMAPLPDSSVEAGDMSTYVAAQKLTFTPDVGQIVTFDDEDWTIMAVGRIYTGDLVALYLLQLRA